MTLGTSNTILLFLHRPNVDFGPCWALDLDISLAPDAPVESLRPRTDVLATSTSTLPLPPVPCHWC